MVVLIAILCILLLLVFRRVFVPLAVLTAVGLGAFLLYARDRDSAGDQRRKESEEAVWRRFARTDSAAGAILRSWEVGTEQDPSTGHGVPRRASILSNDGLCRLQVEQRIDRTRLTGIYCTELRISGSESIEVKFDNRRTSDPMRLEYFSNGRDVYIPSRQGSSDLDYDAFLRRLTDAGRVSLRVRFDMAGERWITFSLAGSASALARIGALSTHASR